MPFNLDADRLALLYRWLSYCIHRHPACGERELSKVYPERVEIILIDVKQMCLFNAATNVRYLALSYVWGQISQFNTRAGNLGELLKPGSLHEISAQIPNVIQDAIQLTRSLGETYLWVDSLCIVQDDPLVKHKQLSAMAEIYNSATATLIACSGRDAQVHLFDTIADDLSDTEMDEINRIYDPKSVRSGRNVSSWRHGGRSVNNLDHFDTGIRRPLSIKTELDTITNSYYSQRGWCYQERLLSRRQIFFLGQEVIFHCRSDYFSEFGEKKVKFARPTPRFVLERSNAIVVESPKTAHESEWPAAMTPTCWDIGFKFWSSTIREYSSKQFTFSSDILDACAGILHAFQGYSTWTINEGMPEEVLDLALLWQPISTVKRRVPITRRGGPVQLPSWSWIGWEGEVGFDLVGEEDKFTSHIYAFVETAPEEGVVRTAPVNVRKSRCFQVPSFTYLKHEILPLQLAKANLELPKTIVETTQEEGAIQSEPVRIRKAKRFRLPCFRHRKHRDAIIIPTETVQLEPEISNLTDRMILDNLAMNPLEAPLKRQDSATTYVSISELCQLPDVTSSTTLLRFQAYTVSGATFLQADLEPTMPAADNTNHIILSSRQGSPCGVLFGISSSQWFAISESLTNLRLILLSNSNIIGDEKDGTSNVSMSEYWQSVGSSNAQRRPREVLRNDDHILNVMLIEINESRYAERVAIGQISSLEWAQAEPELQLIILG